MASRREVLKGSLAALGGAGASALLPGAIARAHAITPAPGSTWLDAEHIVILMQENRSFDHLFGTLRGVRGFNDPRAPLKSDGESVFVQRNPKGEAFAPWHVSLADTRITWLGDLPHGRQDQLDARNGGCYDYWLQAKVNRRMPEAPLTMAYHTREDAPFYYQLADAFTVCDQHFCSMLGPTAPNRLLMWSGTVLEKHETGNLHYLTNHLTHPGGLQWSSFPERLQKHDITWKVYQNTLYCETPLEVEADNWLGNFGDNSMERFEAMPVHFSERFSKYAQGLIDTWVRRLDERMAVLEQEQAGAEPGRQAEIEDLLVVYRAQRARVESRRDFGKQDLASVDAFRKALRARGLAINDEDPHFMETELVDVEIDGVKQQIRRPKGDVLHRFRKDVREGTLPSVSWLVPPGNFSDHPGVPWHGAWYLSEVMNILTENPDVWRKTIFILTYDENDGFFDHQPPFVAPKPGDSGSGAVSAGIDTADEYSTVENELLQGLDPDSVRVGPVGLGYRVPMVVASPWTRGGWVNSEVADHTSTIRLVEKFVEGKFGIKLFEDNISDWRRTVCGDLTSCFRKFEPDEQRLDFIDMNHRLHFIETRKDKPLPDNYVDLESPGAPPLENFLWQEPGVRSSCALAYELSADCHLDPARGLVLELGAGNGRFGERSLGGAFNVYLYDTKQDSRVFDVPAVKGRMAASSYAVKPGDALSAVFEPGQFAQQAYSLAVHGPNGFQRVARGSLAGDPIRIQVRQQRGRLGAWSDKVVLRLENPGDRAVTVRIADSSYGKASRTVEVPANSVELVSHDVAASFQWYDLMVTVPGNEAFLRRFSGRWENGQHQVSDPAMGVAGPGNDSTGS